MHQVIGNSIPQVQGEFTLKLRNVDTLEVEWEHTYKNAFTHYGSRNFTVGASFAAVSPVVSGETLANDIQISEDTVITNPVMGIFPTAGSGLVSADSILVPLSTDPLEAGPPLFTSTEQRFNNPVLSRTIRTVLIGENVGGRAWAMATVSPACVQDTTQILDITYRLQFFEQPQTSDSVSVAEDYPRGLLEGLGAGIFRYWPQHALRCWTGAQPPSPNAYQQFPTWTQKNGPGADGGSKAVRSAGNIFLPVGTFGGPRVDLSGGALQHFRTDYLVTKEFVDDVGQMYGSLLYGDANTSYADNNDTWCSTVMAPFTGPDFANKPIQPVHNHSADAIAPFLDVDFLAGSQGDVIPDGAGWTNIDYPEFYRIEIHGTGAVATARYTARKRNIFTLNTDGGVDTAGDYRVEPDQIPFLLDSTGTTGEIVNGRTKNISAIGAHGLRNHAYREEYDYRKFVCFDKVKNGNNLGTIVGPTTDDGITIMDVVDGSFVNFDPTTTPALGGLDVSQVAVDDSGNVWVADRSAGLFKITDPLGAASIVHFSFGVHGIPSVAADTACYGVAIGNGTSVWAMFEDGLSETTDGGTSWANFDPGSLGAEGAAFTFVGITDGNWSDVWFIRANRDAIDPNNEIGIAKRRLAGAGDSSLESEIVWWTKASGGTATGTGGSLDFNTVAPAAFNCSRRGGLWLKGDTSYLFHGNEGATTTNGNTFHVIFGTTTGTKQDISTDSNNHRPANFLYDNYDAPYFVCSQSRNSFQGNNLRDGLHSGDLTAGTTGSGDTTHWAYSPAFHDANTLGRGIVYIPESDTRGVMHYQEGVPANRVESMLMLSHHVANTQGDFPGGFKTNLVPGEQPLNLDDTPMEEIVWDKYNWDGGSWTKGFHFPAVDSAGGAGSTYPPTDGVRKNFHAEDYTFYGRSLIDASPVFIPGIGAATPPGPGFSGPVSDATFCFSITPSDKDDFVDEGAAFFPGAAQRQEDERILLSIEDPISGATAGRAFRVWWEDPTGSISVEQDGVFTVLAPTPADGPTFRVVVVIDSAGAVGPPALIYVYVDGVLAGVPTALAVPYDWSNPAGTLIAYVGSRVFPFWQLETPHPFYFFRGDITNIQYWNVPFAAADIAGDFGLAPGGIIPAYSLAPFAPATILVGRHELITSLTGTETKTTHVASEAFINGIDIAFAAGVSGTDFEDTDYFTFGVMDGIWKDNAIEMTQQFSMYSKPVDLTFSDFDNGSAGTTIPAAPVVVTEPHTFRENSTVSNSGSGPVHTYNTEQLRPGAIELVASGNDTGAVAHQGMVSGTNGNVTFGVLHGFMECSVGLTASPAAIGGTAYRYTTSGTFTHALRFNNDGSVDAYDNNVNVSAGVTTYVAGDTFEIIKTGATITYEKNGGLFYTSGASAPASTLYPKITGANAGAFQGPANSRGIYDATVTFTRPAFFMDIGIPGSTSGKYDSDFLRAETDIPESVRILIGGSPAAVTVSDTYMEGMVTPGAGTVTINGEAGWLLFNAADVGSAVTGDVTAIFDRI